MDGANSFRLWLMSVLLALSEIKPMQHNDIRWGVRFFEKCGLALAICTSSVSVRACTIFVLTDANSVFFCNNEDWSNPKSRIWFVPANTKHYGCVYVGFDDGFAQGGMNTEGLASDWVADSKEPWN